MPDFPKTHQNLETRADGTFADDVRKGLTAARKSIPCIYFYDSRGSELFEDITRLPEYYLTRSETEILKNNADDIAGLLPTNTLLIELGSGSSVKTRHLIQALLSQNGELEYIPIDVSSDILEESAEKLDRAFPGLEVNPLAVRYKDGIDLIEHRQHNPKLILWLGSSIGNYGKEEAVRFIRHLCERLPAQDRLLIGIDLLKNRNILEPAYNDSRGITAQFNLNLLHRINRELGGHFQIENFRHRAVFNEDKGCVELFLESRREQNVVISSLDLEIRLTDGERIDTEESHKYSLEEIKILADRTNLRLERQWFDHNRWFSVNLFFLKD
ncbi:MAG: L-histidine N(alpha)-methyltransferase [Acidobacteriota bacterium]|nr:L-histidine N(alpha)-methyltransferase [Acidobacteriota bacterium]